MEVGDFTFISQSLAMATASSDPSPPANLPHLDAPPLPNHLLLHVLSLLPLKTLFRLRCVCKQWRSLPFSLLFADNVAAISPTHHHSWIFLFLLRAYTDEEYRSRASSWSFSVPSYDYYTTYGTELIGSFGYSLEVPFHDDENSKETYRVLAPASHLVSSLETDNLSVVTSLNGLLLFALHLGAARLKLFVYNPLSRDVRSLPATRYVPHRLCMVACKDGNGVSGYKVYSFGWISARNWIPFIEVFDTTDTQRRWRFVSNLKQNVSTPVRAEAMAYVSCKTVASELGFLYWMPCLGQKSSRSGRHYELSIVHAASGVLLDVPSLLFKTTFAHMWMSANGLKFICGVAQADDVSQTCGVQIWDLVQEDESSFDELISRHEDVSAPGMQWRRSDQMPQDLWELLSGKGSRRVACVVSIPLLLVVAESEQERMVVYNVNNRLWRLAKLFPLLQGLFNHKSSPCDEVYPWTLSFTPNASALV